MKNNIIKPSNWRTVATFTINSSYFYVAMEWIFFVTKPSSLSILSLYEKVKVLAVTGGIVAFVLTACLLILSLPAKLVSDPVWQKRLVVLSYIPSTMILSSTVLIMIDNFTYTTYKFGIVSTEGILRVIYAVGFLVIFQQTFRFVKKNTQAFNQHVSYLSLGLLAISALGFLAATFSSHLPTDHSSQPTITLTDRPNIIILGSDGLSAQYMSVYGYEENTTPFLDELAKTSLVAENAFTNASSTTASTTSALTGKEPATTNVIHYPDILSGVDSFEHLPGILKQRGYKTVEYGIPYYVDASKLNLLDGFDIVNDKSMNPPVSNILMIIIGNSPSTYFTQTITERASDRLLHIFILKDMQNPLKEVVSPNYRIPDEQRVNQIISLLDQTEQPVFIFTHLMNTHGPIFAYDEKIFSTGSGQIKEWDKGYYKDAIISFDRSVEKIYNHLAASGKLNNTILVIYTDHGYGYSINHRIPIIIHFPNDDYASRRKTNVEIIDIPITILDYLDLSIPQWMTGISMISDEAPVNREIFSIEAVSSGAMKPPFNQIERIQIIVCQKWYTLDVQENSWKTGNIAGYTNQCDEITLPSDDQAHQKILDYLENHNFDITPLAKSPIATP